VAAAWRLGRVPALDGIRAAAAILVMFGHAGVPGFEGGGLGVEAFFTLSGFLITSLLVEELIETDRIRLRRFWLRRFVRLYPAMLVMTIAVAGLLTWMPPGTRTGIQTTLLYYSNWQRALVGDVGALGHTWSLGIEEQFYLVWPLVLIALWMLDRSLRVALWFSALAVVGIGVAKQIAIETGRVTTDRWYNGFDYRVDAILIGCLLAFAMHRGSLPRWIASPRSTAAAIVACLVIVFGREFWGATPATVRTIICCATAVLIAGLVSGPRCAAGSVLGSGPARWLGARSYALYLWHYPICRAILDRGGGPWRTIVAIALSLIAAELSYRLVESPILALRDRSARSPATAADPGRFV
jgi:peptidoglycan/LPS O-acetylase OafA/YrhL